MSRMKLFTHIASPTLLNDQPPPPKSPKDQTKSLSLVVRFIYFSPVFKFLQKSSPPSRGRT